VSVHALRPGGRGVLTSLGALAYWRSNGHQCGDDAGMSEPEVKKKLLELYPALDALPREVLDDIVAEGTLMRVPAGEVMFDDSQPCRAFPLLLEGSVRVTKQAPNGREMQLYRVFPGEACILSSSCLLGHAPYSATGVTETPAVILALAAPLFDRLIGQHPAFRKYVFGLFAERITDLMQLVEAVAFQRLDQRLAALLLGKGRVIHTTHQQLADEIGSVREIITRLLRRFADQGLVALSREQIEIRDAAGLRAVAANEADAAKRASA
jgi:CRP/FNR family transcriptional regulator